VKGLCELTFDGRYLLADDRTDTLPGGSCYDVNTQQPTSGGVGARYVRGVWERPGDGESELGGAGATAASGRRELS
jgi:hypothetical protein